MKKDDCEYKPRHSCGGNLVDKVISVKEDIFGLSSIVLPLCSGCGNYVATGFCGKKEKAEFKDPESAVRYIQQIIENKPREGYL